MKRLQLRVIKLTAVTLVSDTSVATALCSQRGCPTLPPPAHLLPGNKIPRLAVPSQQLGTAAQRRLSPLLPRFSPSGVLPWLPSGRPGYLAGRPARAAHTALRSGSGEAGKLPPRRHKQGQHIQLHRLQSCY